MNSSGTLCIGIDDTDSPKGMCTTFLAYKIVGHLRKQGVEFLDFPRLIRFNPNIPWKTRGNGAVSLKLRAQDTAKIKSQVKGLVRRYSDTKNGANPGLVFFESKTVPEDFSKFSDLALWQLISRRKARKFAAEHGLDFFYQGNGQGLVGAIGAIGYSFDDHTFELLSYRKRHNFGKKRQISAQDVQVVHEKNPGTFSSFDEKRRRVLIAPHGPDPVFYGIRGEDVESLLRAAEGLKTSEQLDGYMIFKSNQGTGDHLKNRLDPANMRPYASGRLTGTVKTKPRIARGGHVFFTISLGDHEFRCAVYRPTGMSHVAMKLIPGDRICVGGGVRKASKNFPRVLNVEFLDILDLKEDLVLSNPVCNQCSKSMKSKGIGQGYQCSKCGRRSSKTQTRSVPRNIRAQLYLPAVSAHRHLTRPLQRAGRKNTKPEFSESVSWVCEGTIHDMAN